MTADRPLVVHRMMVGHLRRHLAAGHSWTVPHVIAGHLVGRDHLVVLHRIVELIVGRRGTEGRVGADVRRTRFVRVAELVPPLHRVHGELLFVLLQNVVVLIFALRCGEEDGQLWFV